jgi:hypothetical protein
MLFRLARRFFSCVCVCVCLEELKMGFHQNPFSVGSVLCFLFALLHSSEKKKIASSHLLPTQIRILLLLGYFFSLSGSYVFFFCFLLCLWCAASAIPGTPKKKKMHSSPTKGARCPLTPSPTLLLQAPCKGCCTGSAPAAENLVMLLHFSLFEDDRRETGVWRDLNGVVPCRERMHLPCRLHRRRLRLTQSSPSWRGFFFCCWGWWH